MISSPSLDNLDPLHIDHAFANGARIIEAYPVDEASPSYRFMGFRDMFASRGFYEPGMAGSRRHVMRLEH